MESEGFMKTSELVRLLKKQGTANGIEKRDWRRAAENAELAFSADFARHAITISKAVRYITLHKHGTRHDIYINPSNGKKSEVPRHQSQEIGTGLKEKILKDLGLK